MRLYIIGFMVGVIGLVAANQVRAGEGSDLGRDVALKVAHGQTGRTERQFTPISNPDCPDDIPRYLPQDPSRRLS